MKLSASSTNLLRPTRTMNKVSAFLKNLFPRNIDPSSADLPNKRSDFSAPHPHKGIKINKNFLLTLITSLLGVIVYSFFISFTPSEKTVTSQDEPAKKVTLNNANPFDTLPSSYDKLGSKKNIEPKQPIHLAPAAPQLPLSAKSSANLAKQKMQQELEQAMRSKIGFYAKKERSQQQNALPVSTNPTNQTTSDQTPNDQTDKLNFLASSKIPGNVNANFLRSPLSKYEIKAGSFLPCALITGINTDLPGSITGQLTENIYDSATGNHLLLPQGTKLIGTYDSKIVFGQYGVLLIWQRLLLPNGQSLNIENMQGTDLEGYSGLRDRVDNHSPDMLRGILLSSLMSAVAVATTSAGSDDDIYRSEAGRGAAEATLQVGNELTRKNLNRQPTLKIRPGHLLNILVHKDLVLAPYTNE